VLLFAQADFEGDDEDDHPGRMANGNTTILWREEMHKRYQQEQLIAEIQARSLNITSADFALDKVNN
jgi:hypothetical protein